jgi:hypothetical protein
MIQCKDCEHYEQDEHGRRIFRCDPFQNIKESDCLLKWQLLRMDLLVSHYQTMLTMQQKLSPVQDKILKYVKRELEDIDEADSWKTEDSDEPDSPPPIF